MEITKEKAEILLEALLSMPVNTTIAGLAKGVQVSPTVVELINELQSLTKTPMNPDTETAMPETSEPEATETPTEELA